jgi:hypothetical protein
MRVFLIKIEKRGCALIYKHLSHLLVALWWLLRPFNAELTFKLASMV